MNMRKKPLPRIEPLETSPEQGLTSRQVAQRVRQGLVNTAKAKADRSGWQILRDCCFTYFNFVFTVMAVWMLLVGSSVLNLTFMVVVVVNTAIGCVQQLRAKQAVDKLTLVAAQQVMTLRGGTLTKIRSDLLVRDDIVEFSA